MFVVFVFGLMGCSFFLVLCSPPCNYSHAATCRLCAPLFMRRGVGSGKRVALCQMLWVFYLLKTLFILAFVPVNIIQN